MHPLLEDPWVAAEVEAAVAPFVGRLSEAEVAWMRDELAETLASDEKALRLARRARPPAVEQSGEVRREPGAAVTPISAAKRAKKQAG